MTSPRVPRASRKPWIRWAGMSAGALAVALIATFGLLYFTVTLPAEPRRAQSTVLIDVNGKDIASLYDVQNRSDVLLDQVSDNMKEAMVAAEDRDFYSHSGVDPVGITRALVNDLRGGRLQGGSTITQQLVKNTFLTPRRSLSRKAKEAVLAIKVEQQLSKKQILERYLNTVYFGRSAYGVQTASQTFFGKSASSLDLAESATLAGLVRSPERGDPQINPNGARRRRAQVLDALVQTHKISQADADSALSERLNLQPRVNGTPVVKAGGSAYFVEEVRKWAVQRYGEKLAYTGGLRIQTTLDTAMQRAAEQSVNDVLNQANDPSAALVALDEKGGVKAMVGGKGFAQSKVNLALGKAGGGSGRQAGSTFKPFVLAAAIEKGVPISQTFQGPSKITINAPTGPWDVTNFNNENFGQLNLTEATVHSVNTVYAQLINQIGPDAVVSEANSLGIEQNIQPLPSVALGAVDVAPLDMTRAFLTFARRGDKATPYYVLRVTDRSGHELYKADPKSVTVMDKQKADLVNHVLQEVPARGTGTAAKIGLPMAGKTGTTENFVDAWFVGYTPKFATGVWMGYPEGSNHPMINVHGVNVAGGTLPAEIWRRFMSVAMKGVKPVGFVAPPPDLLNAPPVPPSTDAPVSTTSSTGTSSSMPQSTSTNIGSSTTSSSSSTSSSSTSSTLKPRKG